jgi:hypothetical protein
MDSMMRDEIARLYPGNVSSDFEDNVRGELIDWILLAPTPLKLSGVDMKEVIAMFWNERLN